MKTLNIFLLAFFLLACQPAWAQKVSDYSLIKLEKDSDYPPAEKSALEAATYFLATPIEPGNYKRQQAIEFLLLWMSGTPDYAFNVDASVVKYAEGTDFVPLFMAAMAKYGLEHKDKFKDDKAMKLGSMNLVLDYFEKGPGKPDTTDPIKKLIAARKKGKLESELNEQ